MNKRIAQSFSQNIVNKLCDEYNLTKIPVIFDDVALVNPMAGGFYDPRNKRIVINEDINPNFILEVIYHEFRHYWQHMVYTKVFCFWTCESGGLYKEKYSSLLCSIEADARLFGESHGKHGMVDLLELYDVEELRRIRDDETYRAQVEEWLNTRY